MTHSIDSQYLNLQSNLNKISSLVGNTPLYQISNVFRKTGVEIFVKLEWQQLGGSIKSRPAFNIIKNAIIEVKLNHQKELLDATSGNTGIAYASIGAALGIPVNLCLPENASKERIKILRALGANIIFTSKFESTDGAQSRARELVEENPDKFFYADQYANDHNWKAHFNTTGVEILGQTNGKITHFVAGLGTTGTFTGTGRRLKKNNQNIELVALQPDNPMHGLEGWKHLETAKVPKIYDGNLADRNLKIDTLEAYDLVKMVAQKEGLLISPSAAANLLGAIKIAKEIEEGVIVTIFADNAEKYSDVMNHIF